MLCNKNIKKKFVSGLTKKVRPDRSRTDANPCWMGQHIRTMQSGRSALEMPLQGRPAADGMELLMVPLWADNIMVIPAFDGHSPSF